MNFTPSQYEEYLHLKQKEVALIEEQQRQRQNTKDQINAGFAGFTLCAILFSIFRD